MRVHISTRPIRQASRVRGVGVYTRYLTDALIKSFPADQYLLSDSNQPKVDLIHYPYFEPFFLTLPLYHPIPTVVTIHDLIPLKYPAHFPPGLRGRLKWFLQKVAVRRSTHIITDSAASARDIADILSVPQPQISIIPLAAGSARIDAKTKNQLTKKYHLPKDFLLYVGDINWNKNIPGLIRAFTALDSPSLHLVLIGQAFASTHPSPELLEIQALIRQSSLFVRIHLIGYVPSHHLPGIYSLASLYIQPSWDEGFGLTLLEAMSAGCPVLSSNRGSLPEVGGEAAMYFDPGEKGDLTQKIAALTRSASVRADLIQKGKLQLKRFSWEQTAKLTHAVYAKVLANH